MKKFFVEFAFADNFCSVDEWDAELMTEGYIESESPENAAKWAANTDGLEDALFRVYELAYDQFGDLEKSGDYQYFSFNE